MRCDDICVDNSLGQVGKKFRHFVTGLEILFAAFSCAVRVNNFRLIQYAHQCVRGFVIVRRSKAHIVRRDNRDILFHGDFQKFRLCLYFVIQPMPLDFHIETVAKYCLKSRGQIARKVKPISQNRRTDWPSMRARQTYQTGRMRRQFIQCNISAQMIIFTAHIHNAVQCAQV